MLTWRSDTRVSPPPCLRRGAPLCADDAPKHHTRQHLTALLKALRPPPPPPPLPLPGDVNWLGSGVVSCSSIGGGGAGTLTSVYATCRLSNGWSKTPAGPSRVWPARPPPSRAFYIISFSFPAQL